MRSFDDPACLTADGRFRELAGIFAAGVLRLRAWAALSADPGQRLAQENPAESASSCLEVSDETVLSVHNG